VYGADSVERIVRKWVGKHIEIMDDIDSFQRRNVQSNTSGPLVLAATYIKDSRSQRDFCLYNRSSARDRRSIVPETLCPAKIASSSNFLITSRIAGQQYGTAATASLLKTLRGALSVLARMSRCRSFQKLLESLSLQRECRMGVPPACTNGHSP
jgi:hypothetical protein